MTERYAVYVRPVDDEVISSIFCEQDSLSPRCQKVIELVKQLTTILQAHRFRKLEKTELLKKLRANGVTLETIRLYLLCNLTLRETLHLNHSTRDCWILALQRMDINERQIANAIQLGQHFAFRCSEDEELDPLTLVTNTILHCQPPADLQFLIPKI